MLDTLLRRFALAVRRKHLPREHLGLFRLPKANCWDCEGHGGWTEYESEDEWWWLSCHCTPTEALFALPLPRRRRQPTGYSDEPPF